MHRGWAAAGLGAGAALLFWQSRSVLGIRWGKPLAHATIVSGWARPREYRGGIHRGVDLPGRVGEPVFAAAAGVVERVDAVDNSFAGRHVILRSRGTGGLPVYHRYLHLDSIAVTQGQAVRLGQPIGTLGTSGTTTANPHVHIDVEVAAALATLYVQRFGTPNPAPAPGVAELGINVPAEAILPVDTYAASARAWAREHGVVIR